MRIVITGGHHTSALPVIEKLRNSNQHIELFWVGHKHTLRGNENESLEYREITSLGVPFYTLHAGKVYRTYDIKRLIKVPCGFVEAFILLLKIRPDVILSFGGYLAVPVVVAGFLLGIPSVTHEQTTVVGYANKLISYFAKKILVSWESSAKHFPKKKVVVSGLPLRKVLFNVESNSFEVNLALPTIYITGGKTGSHKINMCIKQVLPDLLKKCNVIHQCGDNSVYNDFDVLQQNCALLGSFSGKYFLRKFVLQDEIGEVFKKAGIFITRGGAHTTFECKTFKKQSIVIPIPWVSHNEQYNNARTLQDLGLGVILEEKDLTAPNLLDMIDSAIGKYRGLGEDFWPLYDETPARIIVDETLKAAEQKKKKNKS